MDEAYRQLGHAYRKVAHMRMPRVGRRVLLLGSIHFVLCTGAVLDGQPAAGGAGLQKATRQEDYIKAAPARK